VGDEQESPEIGVAEGEFIRRLKLVATLLSVKFTLTRQAETGTSDVITGLFGFVCASLCDVYKNTPTPISKSAKTENAINRFIKFIITSVARK
jgi:hypothetical protein